MENNKKSANLTLTFPLYKMGNPRTDQHQLVYITTDHAGYPVVVCLTCQQQCITRWRSEKDKYGKNEIIPLCPKDPIWNHDEEQMGNHTKK